MRQVDHFIAGGAGSSATRTHKIWNPSTGEVQAEVVLGDAPGFMAVGLIWMLFHVILLLLVAKLIKAPVFFVAVGSKANVGGAASAPVVAAAFHPALAPVGVLLAVLGYALGTYGAILCAQMMAAVG